MAIVDLHLHTTASDGRLSPTKLVRFLDRRGIKIASITDHDSTDGLAEAFEASVGFPQLTIIPGVELNTDIPGSEIHILGYFVPLDDQKFQSTLEEFRSGRVDRAKGIVDKLVKMGLEIEWDRVLQLASGGALARPHIAQALVEKGYVDDIKEAFTRFLGRNGPAYVDRREFSPAEAIGLIRDSGGVAVLAHPSWVENVEDYLPELRDAGLEGMEVYYGKYPQETVQHFAQMADKYNLISCGGSDYHALGSEAEALPGDLGPPAGVVTDLRSRSSRKGKSEEKSVQGGVN